MHSSYICPMIKILPKVSILYPFGPLMNFRICTLDFLPFKSISHLTMVCYHQNPIGRILGLIVINNINHIRFITNKWDWFTFLLKPFLEFGATLFHVLILLVEEAPIDLLDSTLGRYFTFPFLFGLILIIPSIVINAFSPNSIFNLPSSWTHMVRSSLIDHLSLSVL